MAIDDRAGRDLDRRLEGVVVVFNACRAATTQTVPSLAGSSLRAAPRAGSGDDPVVRRRRTERGAFTVPARTVAVFVAPAD